MATTIEVNKQSVKQLLETGKVSKFIIPEYQRPYAWTDEQIQTLFDDLVDGKYVVVPFDSDFEFNGDPMSVYTIKRFDKYNLEVIR